MHLLSALSSTTSPLAMQAMPLVAPGAGDFAALIAGMVPAGDAAETAMPVERQVAAPAGNGLPVAIAAPVALAEAPADAVPAIAPPLPVSATEAVLMLPQTADAPVAKPMVTQAAPVLVAIGVLASVLPEKEPVEAPPRADDVALRTLPMPVPTRFAAPQPRVKRAETPTPDTAPQAAAEGEGDLALPALPTAEAAMPIVAAPLVVPQPAEAIVVQAAPPPIDPPASPDERAQPAASILIEAGQVVSRDAMPAKAQPMRMAKRAGDGLPTSTLPQASVAEPKRNATAKPVEPAIGVVTPLDTDRVVPVHVVVPPVADDVGMVPARPIASAVVTPGAPSAALRQGVTAPSVAGVAPPAVMRNAPMAVPGITPVASAASPANLRQGAAVPIAPSLAGVVPPAVVRDAPMAMPDPGIMPAASAAASVDLRAAPDNSFIGAGPATAAEASPVLPMAPVVAPTVPSAILPAVSTVAVDPLAPTVPSGIVIEPARADEPARVAASGPILSEIVEAAPTGFRPAAATATNTGTPAATADALAGSRPMAPASLPTDTAPIVPLAAAASQPAAPVGRSASAPLRDAAPAVAVGTAEPDAMAPTVRPIAAERAPMTGEAAAPVVPVAAPAPQGSIAAAPVTRIAPVPLPDAAPVVEGSAAIVAPTVRQAVGAPAIAPAAPPVKRLADVPVPDAVPVVEAAVRDTDTLPARARRDDDASIAGSGPLAAPDAAVLRPVAPTGQAAQPTLDTRQPQWVEGMIDRITTLREASGTTGNGETRIRLSPDALGDVQVSIRTGDDGKLHVHFNSDNADAGRLLAEAQPRLVQMAEARGLKLGGMQVDVGTQQQPQQSQRQAQDQGNPAPRAPRSATTRTTTQSTRSDDRIA
ncbi:MULTISPECIES: flagellar hook-length control protein FliK [unclassified Sphingomonas]|uniref:flagellar hook-length control protein FliK n=1 Tax=unclassified Sphingomonas TaxID=196159 RepID=UPI000AD8C8D6|nr:MULTISPECIES: flagellar hook-length control protein FliK [unclassified Sphingomonas]